MPHRGENGDLVLCSEREKSIALFDSGLGGLSVLIEIRNILPEENYIYFGDSRNAPYGERTAEEITKLSDTIVGSLIERDVKCVVIACNTATSRAAGFLREK